MKRTYSQPKFWQVELNSEDVILTSIVSNGTLDGDDGQTFEDIF
jgi:hypothetical protein